MARTYSNVPVLSKMKIGESTYWLKDADARAILDGIDAGVYESLKLAFGQVADGGDNLVKAGDIKAYVDQIAELGFDVVKLASLPTADASAYEAYHNNIVLIENPDAASGACIEYVILRSGEVGSYICLGKNRFYQGRLSAYVSNVSYADATHTLSQTKGGTTTSVHVFGDFADADKGEVDLSGYVKGVSASVETISSIDSIDVYNAETGTLPSKAADTFNAGTLPTKAADTWSAGSLPSKEADTWSAGTLPSKTADTWNAGTLPSFTYGAFTTNVPTSLDLTKFNGGSVATLTTQTKALYKQGVKAEVGTGVDAETLIISNVEEADIKVVDQFNGGAAASLAAGFYTAGTAASKVEDFDAGTLPNFVEGEFRAGTLPNFEEGEFNAGALPSFTEGRFTQGALPSFTEGAFNAGAFPTTKEQPITFSKAASTVAVTLTPGGTEEVNPK